MIMNIVLLASNHHFTHTHTHNTLFPSLSLLISIIMCIIMVLKNFVSGTSDFSLSFVLCSGLW